MIAIIIVDMQRIISIHIATTITSIVMWMMIIMIEMAGVLVRLMVMVLMMMLMRIMLVVGRMKSWQPSHLSQRSRFVQLCNCHFSRLRCGILNKTITCSREQN